MVFAPVGEAVPATDANAALAEASKTLGGDAVAEAAIGNAPADVQRLDPARARLPWLYATVKVPEMRDGLDIEPMWEADLLEGAVAERAGTSMNVRDDFGGATINAVLPNGEFIEDASGGLGDVAADQRFSSESNEAVRSSIIAALVEAGLVPESVKVLRPMGPAPAVVARTADVDKTAAAFKQLTQTLFGSPPRYEGYYIELRDAHGNAFVRNSASFRTGAGRVWVAPAWKDRVGVKSSTKRRVSELLRSSARCVGKTAPPGSCG